MNPKRRLRLAICICTVVLCLQSGVLNLFAAALSSQEVLSALLFLQTGRILHAPQPESSVPEQPAATHPTQPAQRPDFSADMLVDVQYSCDYRPDLPALLTQPLNWSLRSDSPSVLIVHTHATESYAGTADYHSLNEEENLIAIGEELARILEISGIGVIHDKTYHDHPNYDDSYTNARRTIRQYLTEYPTITLVLDIHRDASDSSAGQLITSATVGGQKSAQLMMVVGTDAGGNRHPNWQENLSLALKLSAMLEQENPGICRPINLRSERFNMDLSAGSLLVEVGGAGNTLAEAKLAANALAQAIIALADGT